MAARLQVVRPTNAVKALGQVPFRVLFFACKSTRQQIAKFAMGCTSPLPTHRKRRPQRLLRERSSRNWVLAEARATADFVKTAASNRHVQDRDFQRGCRRALSSSGSKRIPLAQVSTAGAGFGAATLGTAGAASGVGSPAETGADRDPCGWDGTLGPRLVSGAPPGPWQFFEVRLCFRVRFA